MNEAQRLSYLALMEITPWVSKEAKPNADTTQNYISSETTTWDTLQQQVAACTACSLAKTRTQTVFGVGNTQADLLLVGEAPGFHEDAKGEPFVGRAGQLLDAMLKAIGLDRSQVYIANIIKCRPPKNRDPNSEEVALCTPFLQQQISLLRPKLMVALGRIAAHFLLKSTTPLSRLRGQEFTYGDRATPLLVTYHPAYLLRSPQDKSKALIDLMKIARLLRNSSGKAL